MSAEQTAAAPHAPSGAAPPDLTVIVRDHRPAPQGSKKHVGRGRMVEQSKRVTPWRQAVRDAARAATVTGQIGPVDIHQKPLDGPLSVEAIFTVAKPASAPKRRVTWPITRHSGDIDKLLRSSFDALTDAWAIADDSRVVEVVARKVYPGEGLDALDAPGAVIRIWRLPGVAA